MEATKGRPIVSDSGATIIPFHREEDADKEVDEGSINSTSAFFSGNISNLSEGVIPIPSSKLSVKDLNLGLRNKRPPRSEKAIKVLRTHYSTKLISILHWLGENHEPGSTSSMPHLNKLFQLVDEYTRKVPEDPFSSFISTVYDVIINENWGLDLERIVYSRVAKYLSDINNQKIDYKTADHYIDKLAQLGLNVLPY